MEGLRREQHPTTPDTHTEIRIRIFKIKSERNPPPPLPCVSIILFLRDFPVQPPSKKQQRSPDGSVNARNK